jgi:hypothetical protein
MAAMNRPIRNEMNNVLILRFSLFMNASSSNFGIWKSSCSSASAPSFRLFAIQGQEEMFL